MMNDDTLMIDGLDHCLVGTCMTWHGDMLVERFIYDGIAIVAHLMTEEGMSEDEAFDHANTVMVSEYVGETTPIIMWPVVDETEEASEQ